MRTRPRALVVAVAVIAAVSLGSPPASAQVPPLPPLPVPIPSLPALPPVALPPEAQPAGGVLSPAGVHACLLAPNLVSAVTLLAGIAGVPVGSVYPVLVLPIFTACGVFPAPSARNRCAADADLEARMDEVLATLWTTLPPQAPKGLLFTVRPGAPIVGAVVDTAYAIDNAAVAHGAPVPGAGPAAGAQLGCQNAVR